MARNISADSDGYVYRALISTEYEDGRVYETSRGPYTKRNTASAQITREKRYRYANVTGKVQSAYLNWVDVDD